MNNVNPVMSAAFNQIVLNQYRVKVRYRQGKCTYDATITVMAPTVMGAMNKARTVFAEENVCSREAIKIMDIKEVA